MGPSFGRQLSMKYGEKKLKNRLIVFCLSAVMSLALPCGAQTHYQPIDLGVLPGGSYSAASGVNDQGHVTGSGGMSGANPIHGFLWQKNTGMKDLGTLGGNNSYPEGINDANQIVGQADVTSSVSDAFLWINGTMMDIGSLGAQGSVANAINFDPLTMTFTQIAGWSPTSDNSTVHAVIWNASLQITDLGTLGGPSSFGWANNCTGQVVGRADISSGQTHAFLWGSGIGMVDLGTLGGSSSLARGINCSGTIVGYSYLAGDIQMDAFVYGPNTGMKDIGNLGGSVSTATAINKAGRVVGFSNTPGNADSHAFVWTATGGLQDLNKLIPPHSGWDLQVAEAISDNGRIVGAGTINGAGHAFLLLPK